MCKTTCKIKKQTILVIYDYIFRNTDITCFHSNIADWSFEWKLVTSDYGLNLSAPCCTERQLNILIVSTMILFWFCYQVLRLHYVNFMYVFRAVHSDPSWMGPSFQPRPLSCGHPGTLHRCLSWRGSPGRTASSPWLAVSQACLALRLAVWGERVLVYVLRSYCLTSAVHIIYTFPRTSCCTKWEQKIGKLSFSVITKGDRSIPICSMNLVGPGHSHSCSVIDLKFISFSRPHSSSHS